MKYLAYPISALAVGIGATVGSDILARMWIGGETLAAASSEHLHYALGSWVGTIFLLAPFLVVGCVSAAFQRQKDVRSAGVISTVGLMPLSYFYFQGYQAAQYALAEERWTAAALSIGLLPFAVGIPVVLLVAFAALIALGLKFRMSA